MTYNYQGSCDTCKHYNTDICEGCEWNYDALEDLYEAVSPEEIAIAEEKERKSKIAEVINEYIEIDLTADFIHAYKIAKQFTAQSHFRTLLMGVKVTEDKHLIASDSVMMIDIPCINVPDQFKGKIIMLIEDGKVGLSSLLYPDHIPIFSATNNYPSAPIDKLLQSKIIADKVGEEIITLAVFHTPTGNIYFNDSRIEEIKSALIGEIVVKYNDATSPTVFIGDNASAVVCPIRCGEETL